MVIPLREREKYKIIVGMVCCGLAAYLDGSPGWAMWWLVNALGALWGV